MKNIAALLSLLCLSAFLHAQSPCQKVVFTDFMQLRHGNRQCLRNIESTTFLHSPVMRKIKGAIIKQTSRKFYKKLVIKEIRAYDPASFMGSSCPIYDNINGEFVDFLYAIFFTAKLHHHIPFILRADFTKDGKMRIENQFSTIQPYVKQSVSCSEAVKIATSDKKAPLRAIGTIHLYYHPDYNAIVWQIAEPMEPENIRTKVISAYDGKIIVQYEYPNPLIQEKLTTPPAGSQ